MPRPRVSCPEAWADSGPSLVRSVHAARLARAGVPVRLALYLGMNHGFVNRAGLFPQGGRAIREIADALRAGWRAD